MASNVANRSRRAPNLPNDWSTRQTTDDNFRKSPGGLNCCRDDERHARKYEGTTKSSLCHRQGDTASDHELYNLTEEKTSDEGSITDVETNDNGHGDVRLTYHQCELCPKKYDSTKEYSCCTCGKTAASHRPPKSENVTVESPERSETIGAIGQTPVSPTRNQRNNPRNYANPVNLTQALIAMRKLERLKELQRRREQSERFYSHEIRRLIGENFFPDNTAIVTAATKNRERIVTTPVNRSSENAQNSTEQRTRGGGLTKGLEPQATMTTITRLDCGCVEEKTVRVVKSSIGHVQRCESHRYQERPVSKLSSSYPQELLYRTVESPVKVENHTGAERCTRGKFQNDCGQYRNSINSGSRDLESWDDRRVQMKNRRSPRNLSPVRTNSPVRKYSDTSSNSLEKSYD